MNRPAPDRMTGRFTEDALSFPRQKPRRLSIPIAYRATRLARRIVGTDRVLRFCLNASWMLRRLAWELSGVVFGESLYFSTMALTKELAVQAIPPGASVLDVGCGDGRWCRALAEHARRVVGVDVDAALIERARASTAAQSVEYRLMDVSKGLSEQLAGERFDVALLVHVLEHITDVDALLQSLQQVASVLLIEVPDFRSDALNVVRRTLDCPYYADADHVREYTLEILRGQLARNKWTLTEHGAQHGALWAMARKADA